MSWTVQDIIDATGGELTCGDRRQRCGGIAIDSRTIGAGDAFVAIRGERHDGHAFLREVLGRGVQVLVVRSDCREAVPPQERGGAQIACVAVGDTTRALGDLAAFHRRRSPAEVAAITGSNGKTSTRRMTAAVLARRFAVLEPLRNLNNQIGVPLTLFQLNPRHRWAVLELGTSTPGEIARLAEICRPEIGVITNIGPAHLEGLGSLAGVLREKAALIDGLGPGGRAALNADDPRLRGLAVRPGVPVLWFGGEDPDAVRAARLEETPAGLDFRLRLPGGDEAPVHLDVHGRFMVSNALAAAAVGHLLGLTAGEIAAGLRDFAPVAGRMNVSRLPGGITLIDDAYNANPASMDAALAALQSLRGTHRGVLAMGDMRELGPEAAERHREVGTRAARAGVGRLFACGAFAAAVAEGARGAGMREADIVCGTRSELVEALLPALCEGDWVLVKGSRAMGMEAVVAAVKKWTEGRGR
jgi:UDP-N-acetylmuramoyl-tripeptide--D-alanyl-D-alanine ligase